MINLSFCIVNPWAKDTDRDKHYVVWDKKLSKDWAAELQISRFSAYNLFEFRVGTEWTGRDHAGPSLHVELFGYMFACKIYNTRHWDYETGTWTKYEDKK